MTAPSNNLVLTAPKANSRRRGRLCTCAAYPFGHRPGGGLCRWPDPPAQTWQGVLGVSKPTGARLRSATRRRLCKWKGWHPLRDRDLIHRWLAKLYVAYCRRRGFPWGDDWLRSHGIGRIPAMCVTPDGRDSRDLPKSERDRKGATIPRKVSVSPNESGRPRATRRRIEDADVWAWRWRPSRKAAG